MNGKGDFPRPLAVGRDEFAERWERVFGRAKAAQRKNWVERIENMRQRLRQERAR